MSLISSIIKRAHVFEHLIRPASCMLKAQRRTSSSDWGSGLQTEAQNSKLTSRTIS